MTLSVALCTYNGEAFLTAQLESILQQTLPVQEIVVCDDGSTDETLTILEVYKQQYPQLFRIFKNDTNLGYTKNFEKAMYSCTGDLIITSDQDDIWMKNKVQRTLDFFKESPQFDAVFNDLQIVNTSLEVTEGSYLHWKNISYESLLEKIEEKDLFVYLLRKGCFVLGCAMALKRRALAEYDLKNFTSGHDYYIALKLSFKNKLGFIPETLSLYRQHTHQVCGLLDINGGENKIAVQDSRKAYFNGLVGPYISAVRRAKDLFPHENIEQTELYSKFISKRNLYLRSLSFMERKKFIAQSIRFKYLNLTLRDFLTL